MSGVDELLKLEKLLKIVEEDVRKELEDYEVLVREDYEDYEVRVKREYESKKEELTEKHDEKIALLKNSHESKKALLLSQMRSSLKSELLKILRVAVKRVVKSLDNDMREKYLEYLFNDLKDQLREGRILMCSKGDSKRVKMFYSGDLKESEDIEDGLMVVSEDGKYRVLSDLNFFLEKLMGDFGRIVDEKAGDLR